MYDTGVIPDSQVLVDLHPKTGKLVPWQKHKLENMSIAESCRRIENIDPTFKGRAAMVEGCGNFLEFKRYEDGEKKLNRAYFCKYRLCFMCMWRRSLKAYGQQSQIMDEVEKLGYRFIFGSLTIQNCQGPDLGNAITLLNQGKFNLMRQNKYKKAVHGSLWTLEVTHNVNRKSQWFDTYHPHLHFIWAVKSTYFKGTNYIKKPQFIKDWQKAAKLDYKPNVWIQAVRKGKAASTVKEVTKYVTKPGNLLTDDDKLTDSGIWNLDKALANRRLIMNTGIMKTVKARLKLDDVETGDLVNVDGETKIRDDLAFVLEQYSWNLGYKQYMKMGA